ncbi:MAG: UvrD-helicase domain-containing protein, partial [Acidimicrobiales bacterium]
MNPRSGATQPTARLGTVAQTVALLEPAQRAAVLADDPVVCVLAGAGTGKTRVLTLRVARRLEDRSAHPNHVLVCTFSRKAASELRDRLWRLGVGGDVRAGTFHRTALQLIGRYRAERGQSAPSVLADRRGLLEAVLEDAAGTTRGSRSRGAAQAPRGSRRARPDARTRRSEISRLEAEIGWAKARLVAPEDDEAAAKAAHRRSGRPAARVAEVFADYEVARRRRGVLDLDDLLLHAADLLSEDDSFGQAVRWWHRHLFVDETQDLNEAQYRLLRLLVGDDPDLFVVGDP